MNYENILIELENNIAILTINRPSKLNALNIDTINDLHKAIKTLGKNRNLYRKRVDNCTRKPVALLTTSVQRLRASNDADEVL